MKAGKATKGQSKTKAVTFTCKFCNKVKPIEEMVVLQRFFPPIVVCRDCQKRVQ